MSNAETEAPTSSDSLPASLKPHSHAEDRSGSTHSGAESPDPMDYGLNRSRIWLWIAFALLALILLILWQLQSQTISSDGMGVAYLKLPPASSHIELQAPIESFDQPIDLV